MQSSVLIRLYELRDRNSVRQISCDTADRGSPVESFFSDRKIVADLLTRYYTDYEPQALWVAECNGQVVGYLTGCLDSCRYSRIMMWSIIPRTILKAVFRGILFREEIWRLILAGVLTWKEGGFPRYIPIQKYPAHLHVNLLKDFRGQHIGEFLIERFMEQVKMKGIKGVHLGVREDNVSACRFFERLGFSSIIRYPAVFPYGRIFQTHYTLIYARRLI